ncbi:MAG: FAD-binding oxidoreductase, partial [Firmicutes bacterium]|nr:FAD-binding oxidoreductase [Bacillota bacterium]
VAEGGYGVGSFEYGSIGQNVVSVEMVTPSGEIRTVSGDELRFVNGLEGITGFITRVTLAIRRAEEDVLTLGAFGSLEDVTRTMEVLGQSDLPVWHVSVSTKEFVEKTRQAEERLGSGDQEVPAGKSLLLMVYPRSREGRVRPALERTIRECGGEVMGPELARHEWEHRFDPMRLKRLGPSLVPAEAIIPAGSFAQTVSEVAREVKGIAIEGTVIGRREVTLLGFLLSDERTLAFNLDYTKSLLILDIAQRFGGRPYSVGYYFVDSAERVYGKQRLEEIRAYKEKVDPNWLFNPEKIIAREPNPLAPMMKAARVGQPLVRLAENLASRRPKLARKFPEILGFEAFACTQCGYCRDVCTLYGGRGWESASPRGKWYFLREYLKGNVDFNQEVVETFLLCTTCKRCDEVCQVNIPIQGLWDEMRGELIQKRGFPTFPAFEMMGASFHSDLNIWAEHRENRDAWVPNDVTYLQKGETGYWAGCTASFVEKDIAQNAVHILKEGGIPFTYLGKDEACCGVPMLVSGKWDVWEEAVRHNVAEINKRGIKTMVVSCPGCWVALEHFYPVWAKKLGLEWDVHIRHITEVAAELIRDGKLHFKKPVDLKLTYHDPCHIGRHGGIYDAPREALQAIPGVEFVEMEHIRENGLCCGSVLTRIGDPVASDRIGGKRIAEAEAVGADQLVTTCPCCEFQLRVSARSAGSNLPVRDFASLVAEALGYVTEDPTDHVHQIWDVFKAAIYEMSVPGMVEMMENLLPQMMEMMPDSMKGAMGVVKKLPGGVQDVMFGMMESVMPMMMPKMMDQMLPKMLPVINQYMKEKIPNMPAAMEEILPKIMPEVMARLMPSMLPKVLPQVQPKMMEVMRGKKAAS